ncbi:YT521-B-like domain-containing protein [Phlyctochytrium arcticum]|nr:YT521-B-like domain-containing protein [Phlyctochytrium arcticum]
MPHPAPYFPGLSTNNWKFRRESPQPQQQLPRQRSGNGNMHARHDDAKAMWVGNLPENVSTGEIHEFFRECDIVNIANLSRSRCAFINLTSAIEVERAVKIYNNAVFRGCSIVCRPRKMATGGQSSGTTPMHQPEHHGVPSGSRNLRTTQISQSSITTRPTQPDSQPSTPQYQDRYFILKSLTIDDLHIARDRGCWATQPKNEPILNKAFGNSVNVYLIFSANKSGEFYGYARMESGIDPATSSAADLNVDWMPVGAPTIVNTSAAQHQDHHASLQNRVQAPSTCWGTPFSIRWICTDPLPFSQVKHLRNSWNANKQVKVSRDGIEVESSIGKRLLEEFHKNAITSHPPPGDDPDQLDFARLKLDPPSESFLNVLDPGASTRPTAAAAFSRRHSLDLPHPVPEHFVTNQEDLRKRRMSDVKGDGRHPTAWQEYAVQAAAAHVAAHAAE